MLRLSLSSYSLLTLSTFNVFPYFSMMVVSGVSLVYGMYDNGLSVVVAACSNWYMS